MLLIYHVTQVTICQKACMTLWVEASRNKSKILW